MGKTTARRHLAARCALLLAGLAVMALGVALGVSIEVTAQLVPTAGEGLVLAVCQVTPFKFGNMKVALDVTLVLLSVLLGLLVLGRLEGVREGTVAAALLVGTLTKLFRKPLAGLEKKLAPELD